MPGTPQELVDIFLMLQVTCVGVFSLSLVPLGAVQFDQTTVWATLRIRCREEVGESLQRRSASSCE
jgi:hypothetical protein